MKTDISLETIWWNLSLRDMVLKEQTQDTVKEVFACVHEDRHEVIEALEKHAEENEMTVEEWDDYVYEADTESVAKDAGLGWKEEDGEEEEVPDPEDDEEDEMTVNGIWVRTEGGEG